MHKDWIPNLVCPACHGTLDWAIRERTGAEIREAKAHCRACSAEYPVREGVGLFLTRERPRHDLWAEAETGLSDHLRTHPDLERKLLDGPLERLEPVDQMLRGMVLDQRGDFQQAKAAVDRGRSGVVTPEMWRSTESQVDRVVTGAAARKGWVVDLASGRGYLAERLISRPGRKVVVSDFSPSVLRQDKGRFESLATPSRPTYLAFDARCTPFADRSVPFMVTNLGFNNIENPGDLFRELRRIMAGKLLAVSIFFPREDRVNGEAIRRLGLEAVSYREGMLDLLRGAGFAVRVENSRQARALPSPKSQLLPEMQLDALPVAETTVESCTLVAE